MISKTLKIRKKGLQRIRSFKMRRRIRRNNATVVIRKIIRRFFESNRESDKICIDWKYVIIRNKFSRRIGQRF